LCSLRSAKPSIVSRFFPQPSNFEKIFLAGVNSEFELLIAISEAFNHNTYLVQLFKKI